MKGQWWKEGVVYQIYPASYQDSNGDGIGDIPGIISRLDYVKSIGVDIIWLSPHYKSPQVDMGYDVSDYTDIEPNYGTREQCEQLIQECHKRGLKIIFDLVINHTSDQHQWFKESRRSKDDPKRDWYIWRPAKYDKDGNRQPPNNWTSFFGGSAWGWDEQTQEYYLHLFVPEQPDLNWRSPACRDAIMRDAVYYWFERGVDGYRIDTANMYSKPEVFEDAPIKNPAVPYQDAADYFCNGPEIHTYMKQLGEAFDKFDAMTVGELGNTADASEIRKYVSASRKEMSMVFQFDQLNVDGNPNHFDRLYATDWKLSKFKELTAETQQFIEGNDAWTTTFLENHDRPRIISHLGDDSPEFRVACGKMFSTLFLTQTGTPFFYQGQEIGMINVPKSWTLEDYRDVDAINFYKDQTELHGAGASAKALAGMQHLARDNARTPMQWDASSHAGFTTGKPWIGVQEEYKTINVEAAEADKNSVLNYSREVIKLRKQHKNLFVYGHFKVLDHDNEQVFSFAKVDPETNKTAVVVLNFTNKAQPLPALAEIKDLKVVLGNETQHGDSLKPFEARVYL